MSSTRSQDPVRRSIPALRQHIRQEVLPELLELENNVEAGADVISSQPEHPLSNVALATYLKAWGFDYKTGKDQTYFDGHERDDVVRYRIKWAQQMMEWHKLQPSLKDNEKKMVLVTHDESIFYSNDCKVTRWCEKNEFMILPKGQGRSIMISSFMCPCHGTMRGTVNGVNLISRVIFFPGNSNGDGYWTNKDLTSNHKAFADDALVASRMTSGTSEVKSSTMYRFRDTTYVDRNGIIKPQSMYTMESMDLDAAMKEINRRRAKGQAFNANALVEKYRHAQEREKFKEILRLLRERGLLGRNEPLRRVCVRGTPHDPQAKPGCCAKYLLSQQPDFKAQKNMLETQTSKAGHLFTLYPKYHCECNWIERHWGTAKRHARMECDYSFDTLKSRIEEFLDHDEAAFGHKINRRYYYRAYRYIDAYSKGNDVLEADDIIKKFSKEYRSHRRAV
ncbi:hypothetical protein INT47_006233 [Mucor saturninus]|uniref:Uncharacterized protein n=1 Tax=Mucor saturninus TaxID=64648 RepID=A0A8H7UX99_9FUNG|nr:hypothetical protein INT47_006233 [Mucor saturninus]